MATLIGVKNTYGDILVEPKYLFTEAEDRNFEIDFKKENPQYTVVGHIASVPNWIVVEDKTPRAPKKLPTKKEMIDLILEKGLFKFEGVGATFEFEKFCKKTKAELANYYADALVKQ